MKCSVRTVAIVCAVFTLCMPCLSLAGTITLSGLGTDPNLNVMAINNAIAGASSGDCVQLPAGTFSIGASIQLKSGVNLIGAGQAQTALQYAGTSSEPILNDAGASNVQLQGFTIDGQSSVNASEGIAAANCSGLMIQNVTVRNLAFNGANAEIGPQGIYFSGSVTNSIISGNMFTNIGTNSAWGAAIRLSAASNNNQIVNNTVASTGRGGILLSDSSGNSIIGNTVSGSGVSANGVGLGIEVQGSPDSLIQNNAVDHWISVDTSSGSAIRNNTISDTSGTYKLAGLELVDSQDVVFSHNTVSAGAEVGISISGNGGTSQQDYFGHNTISNPNTWGAQLQGGSGGASEIYFEGNSFTGATNGTAGLYPGNEGVVFRFNGDAHFITLENTQVSGNQGEAMQVGGGNIGDLTFRNTTITNNGDVAVDQDGSLSNVQWTATTSCGNGPYGTWNTVPASPDSPQPEPVVTIDAPGELAPGAAGEFSAKFVEADGTIGNVLWDFDDGLPQTGADAVHSFALPGVYDVAVVVWDQTGYASEAELEVTVTPEPAVFGGLVTACVLFRRPERWPSRAKRYSSATY